LSDHITHISDSTFEEEVLNSSTPVLVDYWAEWCGPCKAIGPVLEDVAPGYSGKVKIVKMNIDENPNFSTNTPDFLVSRPAIYPIDGRRFANLRQFLHKIGLKLIQPWPWFVKFSTELIHR